MNAPEGGRRPRRTALGEDATSLGGKRPRSSMSPCLVEAKTPAAGFSLLALGAPGGTDIIGGTANVLRYVLTAPRAEVRQLQQHTDAPRAIGKNEFRLGEAVVELRLYEEKEMMKALRSSGYNLTHTPYPPPYYVGETYSRVQSAMMWRADEGLEFVGAADSLRLPCLGFTRRVDETKDLYSYGSASSSAAALRAADRPAPHCSLYSASFRVLLRRAIWATV